MYIPDVGHPQREKNPSPADRVCPCLVSGLTLHYMFATVCQCRYASSVSRTRPSKGIRTRYKLERNGTLMRQSTVTLSSKRRVSQQTMLTTIHCLSWAPLHRFVACPDKHSGNGLLQAQLSKEWDCSEAARFHLHTYNDHDKIIYPAFGSRGLCSAHRIHRSPQSGTTA
jgi:hypothetical protein